MVISFTNNTIKSVDSKFSWLNGKKAGSNFILYLRNDDGTYHGPKVKGYY